MNFRDIRDMELTQSLFWAVAVCLTAAMLGVSVFLAFLGGDILETVAMWRDARKKHQQSTLNMVRRGGTDLIRFGTTRGERLTP